MKNRCLDQATVLDPVLDLDVLRPVDGGDQGDVARLQTADVHDRGRRIPPGRARGVKGIRDVVEWAPRSERSRRTSVADSTVDDDRAFQSDLRNLEPIFVRHALPGHRLTLRRPAGPRRQEAHHVRHSAPYPGFASGLEATLRELNQANSIKTYVHR